MSRKSVLLRILRDAQEGIRHAGIRTANPSREALAAALADVGRGDLSIEVSESDEHPRDLLLAAIDRLASEELSDGGGSEW